MWWVLVNNCSDAFTSVPQEQPIASADASGFELHKKRGRLHGEQRRSLHQFQTEGNAVLLHQLPSGGLPERRAEEAPRLLLHYQEHEAAEWARNELAKWILLLVRRSQFQSQS